MFEPKCSKTQAINTGIEAVDRTKWLIENMLIMPKYELWIQRQTTVRRASATTRIEGASLDEAAVGELMKSPRGKLTSDEIDNLNAAEAYDFVDYLSDQPDLPVDEGVIRQINRLFKKRTPDAKDPGTYRNGENTVGEFIPPNQGDVPALMRDFAQWIQAETKTHPILKAGLAHIHLVAIHPFWDGNGRTARALAVLILQTSGYAFRRLLSPESLYHQFRDRYFSAIETTLGKEFRSDYDATPWLEFFVRSLSVHTRQLADGLTDWRRMMDEVHEEAREDGLIERQTDGVIYAGRMGEITRRDYMEIASVSPVTASRDLRKLVEQEYLIPIGRGRGRRYRYNSEDEERAEPPPEQLEMPLAEGE
jgi:Fic family protein